MKEESSKEGNLPEEKIVDQKIPPYHDCNYLLNNHCSHYWIDQTISNGFFDIGELITEQQKYDFTIFCVMMNIIFGIVDPTLLIIPPILYLLYRTTYIFHNYQGQNQKLFEKYPDCLSIKYFNFLAYLYRKMYARKNHFKICIVEIYFAKMLASFAMKVFNFENYIINYISIVYVMVSVIMMTNDLIVLVWHESLSIERDLVKECNYCVRNSKRLYRRYIRECFLTSIGTYGFIFLGLLLIKIIILITNLCFSLPSN